MANTHAGGLLVAVFKYTATTVEEQHTETGTIVAANENEARKKLKTRRFDHVRLKRLGGISGFFSRFTATK